MSTQRELAAAHATEIETIAAGISTLRERGFHIARFQSWGDEPASLALTDYSPTQLAQIAVGIDVDALFWEEREHAAHNM